MRKLKFTLFAVAAMAAVTFTSCDKDNDNNPPVPPYDLRIVGFENEELPTEGYVVKADYAYTEKGLTFDQTYTDWGGGVTSWSGFAVSGNKDKETAGVANQCSVYGSGGAEGSSQFAVSSIWGTSDFSFAEGEAYEIEYAYFTNSTYAYLAIKNGDDGNGDSALVTAFSSDGDGGKGDWFRLTLTGYDAAGVKTGEKEVYLADYRDPKTAFIMTEWTKVDLLSLGKVNKVTCALWSTDTVDYGDGVDYMNTPAYFCIDNVAYREYKVTE